jgi:Flp pilus assembly protein TadG
MRRCAAQFYRLYADRQAVALLEFALVFPLLALIFVGSYNLSQGVAATRQLTRTAEAIADILATTNPPSGNAAATVNFSLLHYAFDATMIEFPSILTSTSSSSCAQPPNTGSWSSQICISMSGIVFAPTTAGCHTSSCNYKAFIVWTAGSKARPCGTILTPAATLYPSPSPSTLPQQLYQSTPIAGNSNNSSPQSYAAPNYQIVVDIVYSWAPSFGTSLIPPITIKRSTYMTPRYATSITYSVSPGDDGFGTNCPQDPNWPNNAPAWP